MFHLGHFDLYTLLLFHRGTEVFLFEVGVLLDSMLIVAIYTTHVLKNMRITQRIMLSEDVNMMEQLLSLFLVTALSGALDRTTMAIFTFYVLWLIRM